MLKIGLVGVGGISGAHIPAWNAMEDTTLTAICDIRPERMEPYPEPHHYTSIDEMLEKEEDMEIFELSGIAPNPKIESVREGVKLCKENSIDMVLAIGGGSVIDCAKVVAASMGSGYYTKMDQESITNLQCPDIISHRIRDG